MRARLDRTGVKTRLTDKQYTKLLQLTGNSRPSARSARGSVAGASGARQPLRSNPSSHSPGRVSSPRRYGYRTNRRSWVARRVDRGTRRLAAYLAIGGILALLGLFGGTEGQRSGSSSPLGGSSVATSLSAEPARIIAAGDVRVVDGDTVYVSGIPQRIRLVGFNTPEKFSPSCNRELQLGDQATARLQQLLNTAEQVSFERVACACRPGTEGTDECNFGRLCGSLYVDDRDVGDVLISEGLAARYQCGRYSCPPPPGNWCG
ncbi:thermonuclease family protein [Roseicyclus salinarum]|uniref:thermonuclease family protein n=1 Tax=Roseicyclus salinarum TaxID=3036773 RepID=UPI003D34B81F